MGVFDHFPYTNFHELNLEWILLALKEIQQTMEDFVSLNAIKYADPIQWNITKQYEKNTIVIDPLTGTAYISVRPVPAGANITDTDYWTVVFDLGQFVVKMAHNLANVVEPETTLTATVSSSYNDWIIWGDVLYRNINPSGIIAGDAYVIGSNISAFTIEDVVGHIQDLTTTDKSNLVAAINEVLQTLINTTGDLDDLTTTDKSNLVAAINEVLQTLINTTGDLNDLDTTDKSNLVAAINEEVSSRIAGDTTIEALILSKIAIDATKPPVGYLPLIPNETTIDNAPRLKALIDDFSYVYVPSGTYTIKTNINMTHGNFTLFGAGDNTIFKVGDEVAKSEMFIFIPSVSDIKNITLANFKWDGNKTGRGISQDMVQQSFITAFTVNQYNIENITLDRLTMVNSCGFVALFAGHNNGSDMTQYITRNIFINNCTWYDNDAYVGTSGAENVYINNCIAYHNGRENICLDNNSINCKITNSAIGTSYGGIGSVGIGTCNNVSIENCTFDYENDTTQPTPELRNCITIANDFGAAMFYSIRNCIFKNASYFGVRIIYTTADTISGIIENCEFNNCAYGAIRNEVAYDKGMLLINNIYGSTPGIINYRNGNIKQATANSIWIGSTTSYATSAAEKILNDFSSIVNHRMGSDNTRGVPTIPYSGFYLIKCTVNVRLNVSNPKNVTTDTHPNNLKLMINSTSVDRDQHSGFWYDCFEISTIKYLNKDDSIEFWMTDFDTSIAAVEKCDCSITYLGTIIPYITDLP